MSDVRQPTHSPPSQVDTVPSGRAASPQRERFPGQGHSLGDGIGSPMEVDGASGRQNDIDWQFYFDTLSPHLSGTIGDLGTYLEISTDQQKSINNEYSPEHEKCFYVLWSWRKKRSGRNDAEKLLRLQHALNAAGRQDLAEKKIPKRNDYEYKETVYDKGKSIETGIQALTVAKGARENCLRLGRYFKLNEDDIARIVSNNADDIVKQGREIIEACIKKKLLTTRQHLCDGLNYIENISLIDDMNDYWGTS